MSKKSRSRPSKRKPTQRQTLQQFAARENASLAQVLLQIVLDNAHLEMFSLNGGGFAVMLFERWQINVLANYGIYFQEPTSDSGKLLYREMVVRSSFPSEILKISEERADMDMKRHVESLISDDNDEDIFPDWLDVDRQPDATPG